MFCKTWISFADKFSNANFEPRWARIGAEDVGITIPGHTTRATGVVRRRIAPKTMVAVSATGTN